MPLSDFRDTYSWREAIDLSPSLINLAEQLPASEEHGLSFRLRKAMIELPASIAYDLGEGNSFGRKREIARLAAMLDIIDKVYPALDTAGARKSLEKLVDRVAGTGFGEQTPGAAKVYMPGAMSHLRPEPGTDKVVPPAAQPAAAADHPAPDSHAAEAASELTAEHAGADQPAPDHAEPASVPVTPAEQPAIDVTAAPGAPAVPPTHVQVTPADSNPEAPSVHPDSE